MFRRQLAVLCVVAGLTRVGVGQPVPPPPAPATSDEGEQVLTRGPVHEAFAETITFDPQPGAVVPKAPPAPIEEVPPDQKPDGANVVWIPGYWAWDGDTSDFIWVSGVWRDVPPGRQWVSGYWSQSGDGYQWTSGFWADAKVNDVEYLPEPPETIEAGPSAPSPSPDDTWMPGCWIWQETHYAWRPGYWVAARPDWIWVPSHYAWTPRGYVYTNGYWDYPVGRRGVLFAPVRFEAGVYARAGFSYSPSVVIGADALLDHLFVRSRDSHYYFGDYYATAYRAAGIRPAYAFHARYGFDPIFAQERWEHRNDHEWEAHVEADFRDRRDHPEARPPRTLAAQTAVVHDDHASAERGRPLGVPLAQVAKTPSGPLHFQPVTSDERHKLQQVGPAIQRFREARQAVEARPAPAPAAAPAERPPKEPQSVHLKMPVSPIVGRPPEPPGAEHAPPVPHKAPAPDPKVQSPPGRR